MRCLPLLPLLLALSGCGEVERSPALAPVRLTVSEPVDRATVEDDRVEVQGTVAPATARVLVAGSEAEVSGGAFVATVELEAGTNVIDVQAGAPEHPAAMVAVRVTRLVPVEVPTLEGLSLEDAVAALAAVGLESDERPAGGLFDDLLPDDVGVCFSSPEAGEEVRAGSTVVLATARAC